MRSNWKKALIGVCICAVVAGTAGCSKTSEKVKEKETATSEPAAKAVDYNEDENSNLGAWARAMGSVLLFLNDGNPYYFGGYMATEDNKNAAVSILSTSWSIHSRGDLLTEIKSLLSEGDRVSFRKEAKEMASMSEEDLKTAMKQLKGDLLVHYQMVQYNWEIWKSRGLLAWDMCRVSHLVQWGYVAGYVSREEAQALIEPAAKRLKEKFTSWEDVQNNWLDGYCLFASVDRNAKNTDYTNRKALYEKLRDEQDKDKPLYDDALFSQNIIPISGVSYQSVMKELKKEMKKKTKTKKKTKENMSTAAPN